MRVTILKSEDGDWLGLYVDGALKIQGHNLYYDELLSAFDIEYDEITKSDEWFEDNMGRCPEVLRV